MGFYLKTRRNCKTHTYAYSAFAQTIHPLSVNRIFQPKKERNKEKRHGFYSCANHSVYRILPNKCKLKYRSVIIIRKRKRGNFFCLTKTRYLYLCPWKQFHRCDQRKNCHRYARGHVAEIIQVKHVTERDNN